MKILTTNFLTCAVKTCKVSAASFPLHFKQAELVEQEMDFNPLFIRNILPRVDWDALRVTVTELGLTSLPESKPSFTDADLSIAVQRARPVEDEDEDEDTPMGEDHVPEASAQGAQSGPDQAPQKQQQNSQEQESLLRNLHTILLETQIVEGILVCGNCGHEYPIKESVANFLLPSHLV